MLDPLDEQLRELRHRLQVELVATVLDPSAGPLQRFVRSPRTALLFGSEGHGLDAGIVSLCQRRVTIPMPPNTDSLNAAVAAGIFLHGFANG
jgi:TrmH family RNA methyltransferase